MNGTKMYIFVVCVGQTCSSYYTLLPVLSTEFTLSVTLGRFTSFQLYFKH